MFRSFKQKKNAHNTNFPIPSEFRDLPLRNVIVLPKGLRLGPVCFKRKGPCLLIPRVRAAPSTGWGGQGQAASPPKPMGRPTPATGGGRSVRRKAEKLVFGSLEAKKVWLLAAGFPPSGRKTGGGIHGLRARRNGPRALPGPGPPLSHIRWASPVADGAGPRGGGVRVGFLGPGPRTRELDGGIIYLCLEGTTTAFFPGDSLRSDQATRSGEGDLLFEGPGWAERGHTRMGAGRPRVERVVGDTPGAVGAGWGNLRAGGQNSPVCSVGGGGGDLGEPGRGGKPKLHRDPREGLSSGPFVRRRPKPRGGGGNGPPGGRSSGGEVGRGVQRFLPLNQSYRAGFFFFVH